MEKAITTALLVIASVVAAVALMNAVYPAVTRGSGALLESSGIVAERVRTDIEIVFVAGNTSTNQVTLWVKNVGSETVLGIEKSDLFLKTPTEIKRIPYNSGTERWTYALEDGATNWQKAVTLKVTVDLTSLGTGLYEVRLIVPNGASAEKQFSV